MDGIMAAQFQAYHLAGAVVGVSHRNEVLLAKGYGQADLERRLPVDPADTLFRLASVTKLFTWTAVMQLAEEGRLDLDQDVNRYLSSLQIPSTFPTPVTLNSLLAHTAGFEDRILRIFRHHPEDLLPLNLLLEWEMPERIRPPGQVGAYSNYGSALAALVVQEVSGLDWERFVEIRILEPLDMRRTSMRQPLPAELSSLAAVGYDFHDGGLLPQPFELPAAAPAGGGSASALDMLRFGAALLPQASDRPSILRPETRLQMQATLYTPSPDVPGMAHGFLLDDWNRQRVLFHPGDLFYMHSGLYLVPEEEFVLFVAFNAADGGRARQDFIHALRERLFPPPTPEAAPAAAGSPAPPPHGLEGWYRPLRRSETTVDKLAELFAQIRVEAPGPGQLRTRPVLGLPRLWQELRPTVYQENRRPQTLVFVTAEDGTLRMFEGNRAVLGYERARWFETAAFHLYLLVACVLVLLTPLLFPLVNLLMEIRSDRMLARRPPTQKPARLLAALVALLFLTFLGWVAWQAADPQQFTYDLHPAWFWMLLLPMSGAVLSVVQALVMVMAWRGGYWGFLARLHYTVITLAAWAMIWQLGYWNFLGWNY
ncbi:MAG: serine hydrolase [Acidobacteriota bacterium]